MRDVFFIVLVLTWAFVAQGLFMYMSPIYHEAMSKSGQLKLAWRYYRSSAYTFVLLTAIIIAVLLFK